MKRIVAVLSLVYCLLLAFAACASAAVFGPVVEAADAAKMPDGAQVVVRGKIAAASMSGSYILEDKSGQIVFTIEPKKLLGAELKANNIAEVAGKIERDASGAAMIEAGAVLKKGTSIRYTALDQAAKMNDEAWVVVKGKLKNAIGDEKYILTGPGGEMTVEIDRDVWGSLTYDKNQTVEIRGEIDVESNGAVILDAGFIREL